MENRTPVTVKEDNISTPVSTFLNNNVTPRSAKRKSRVDSTNTTPTSTPNATPGPQPFQDLSPPLSGLGIGVVDRDTPKRPTVSFSPQSLDMGSTRPSVQQKSSDSKFFFASDVKNVQSPPTRPQLPQQKSSSFFYANGDTIPPVASNSSRSVVGSEIGEERLQTKFFHANGTPDLLQGSQGSPSPNIAPPRPGSTVSTSSRMTSPRLTNSTPGTLSPLERPTSPSKLVQNTSISSLRSPPLLPSPISTRPPPLGRGYSGGVVAARRASLEGKKVGSHARSESTGSIGGAKVSSDSAAKLSALVTLAQSITGSSPEPISEQNVEHAPEVKIEPTGLQSPVKTGQSLEKLNELANNARRERKVLDLEITNSSLAAINRTLEREMRKQTAELRRYRRLSRSGRLSIATTASMRSASGTYSLAEGEEGHMLSDMSEEEEESELEEESDFSDDGSLSPGALEASDLRHRKRDEERLQLDLSKHQQLLIDSQKMNQSLKKCLGWTEELIAEGKKALEYKVMVNDVKLGGRILVNDEGEEDNEGMSDIGAKCLREARLNAAAKAAAAGTSWHSMGNGGSDSTIQLEHSQRMLEEINNLLPAIDSDQ